MDIVERAFAALAEAVMSADPLDADRGAAWAVDVKTAYVPGLDGSAIKVSLGFFDNPKRGLPSLNGLMVLLDAETGIVKAVLLDNGYLHRRAHGGAAVLRRPIPGAATCGRPPFSVPASRPSSIRALRLVRDFEEPVVWAAISRGRGLCSRMRQILRLAVWVVPSPEEAVRWPSWS